MFCFTRYQTDQLDNRLSLHYQRNRDNRENPMRTKCTNKYEEQPAVRNFDTVKRQQDKTTKRGGDEGGYSWPQCFANGRLVQAINRNIPVR